MQQQHHPYDNRLYSKGANRDIDDELLDKADGQYIDACNMRTIPMDGDNGGIKKINGEVVFYPNIDNRCDIGTGLPLSSTYECLWVAEINQHIVEFWADGAHIEPALVRVDGLIVLMSEDFPIDVDYPIQGAKNEACIGGEIYITDYHVVPMLFNIKDLLLNSGVDVGTETGECTDKYFDGFNLEEHLLIVTRTLEHPVFIKLDAGTAGYDQVFGSAGLPVGYVTYSFRSVSAVGDRTAWSAATPQIPIVKKVDSDCENYPWSKTISKDPDISSPSIYGAHIRFRINNEANYDFIEVRRDSWVAGDPFGTPASSELVGVIDIEDGQFGVVNIIDRGGAEETLAPEDITSVMSAVERAKAIRYFNNKLYLMNVEYASRDITESVTMIGEDTGDTAFPSIQKIFKEGHSDPWKATYYKSTMRGEKSGYAILLWDEQGQWSYAKPINGATNFQMPNRREPTSSLTEGTSYYGTVKAANVNGAVGQTHEVFDLVNGVAKQDKCLWANILEGGNKRTNKVNLADCPTAQELDYNGNGSIATPSPLRAYGERIGYHPFTPVEQDSDDCRHLNYRVNLKVENSGAAVDYEPEGFEPDYYSAGVAFHGVDELPSWAKAMSIVRTEPAERVVAQGLGFYQLRSAGGSFGVNTGKETKEFAVYFPDLDEVTGLNPDIIEAIQIDPSSYAIQLVSPVGFFSEIFNFDGVNFSTGTRDSAVDFITYCRILEDNGQINPNENPSMGIDDGSGNRFVSYGKWRASSQFANVFAGGANGNNLFDITDVTEYTSSSARQKYFVIESGQDFYAEANAGGNVNGDNPNVQDFHEPIYIINIVKKVADVPDTNITQYKYTGHYQKIDSVVGISDGSVSQNYLLTDERWEDCIPTLNAQVQSDYDALERFVFIRDTFNAEKRWLNVTNKSAIDITTILTDLQANGSHDVTDASGTYTIYGVYKHSQGSDFTAEEFFLNFSQFDTNFNSTFFLPDTESKVIVKYDKRIPMRVFGGDTWINESTWAVKDKVYNSEAIPVINSQDNGDGQGDLFNLNIAFPYRKYHLNPRIYIVNNTTGANKIQDTDLMRFNNGIATAPAAIRQLIAMWTAETRINLSFAFNDEAVKHSSDQYFPLKNYVMRPLKWDDDEFGSGAAAVYDDNNIYEGYGNDYGDEFNLWGYGGFRFLPQTNIDYSKDDNTKEFSSVPKVGFEEQSLFCTRVIWSERRPINVQDTPSVRTFPSQNFYDISDDTGEIKRAFSAISSKGNNLYAFTDSGLALLLVDKRIISEINANELATVGSDIGGILNELWINRDIGMADEMWRSAAEYSNGIWWANYNSAYKMNDNSVQDIGRVGYHSKIYPEYLEIFGRGYDEKVTGVYDVLHNEYWINFSKGDVIEEEIEFGEGTEHAVNDLLDVVDMAYDVPQDPNDQIVGTNPDETVLITSALGLPPYILLGGNANNMLTHSISICMIPDVIGAQSIEVRYRDENSNIIVLVTINAGECYCFTPSYSVPENPPTWTAEECNPFGMDDNPFDNYACPTLVWGETQGMWQGGFDYNFDKYLSFDNKTYGMRDMETYLLDEGRIINDELIEAHVISSSSVYSRSSMNSYSRTPDKEFVRIRINSDTKPVRVEFFNDLNQLLSNNVQALLDTVANPLHLKNYYGYEQYIPRKTDTPFNRMQGRLLVFKIIHNLDEDFRITSTDIQYKGLK